MKISVDLQEKIDCWLNDRDLCLLQFLFDRIVDGKPKICYFVEQYQLLSPGEEMTVKPSLILTKSWYQYYKACMKYPDCYSGSEGGKIDKQEDLNELLTNTYKPNSMNIILK